MLTGSENERYSDFPPLVVCPEPLKRHHPRGEGADLPVLFPYTMDLHRAVLLKILWGLVKELLSCAMNTGYRRKARGVQVDK